MQSVSKNKHDIMGDSIYTYMSIIHTCTCTCNSTERRKEQQGIRTIQRQTHTNSSHYCTRVVPAQRLKVREYKQVLCSVSENKRVT